MRIVAAGEGIDETQVQTLEARVGRRLPEDYRSFLLLHNALRIRPCVLPTPELDASEKVALHTLTCFRPGETCDFEVRMETYRDRIPPDALPIGSDPGGNLFLLDLVPERLGRVYFWEREYEADEGEPPTTDNVHPIAESFAALLARLVED